MMFSYLSRWGTKKWDVDFLAAILWHSLSRHSSATPLSPIICACARLWPGSLSHHPWGWPYHGCSCRLAATWSFPLKCFDGSTDKTAQCRECRPFLDLVKEIFQWLAEIYERNRVRVFMVYQCCWSATIFWGLRMFWGPPMFALFCPPHGIVHTGKITSFCVKMYFNVEQIKQFFNTGRGIKIYTLNIFAHFPSRLKFLVIFG